MYFTLSGDFLPEGRTYFVQKLLKNGHHVEAHITENTDFLIISEDAINYKKVKEAILKNIPILKKKGEFFILEEKEKPFTNWSSITIENHKNEIEWIATDVKGKEYSGFWQKGNPLTDEEVEKILSILISKTDKLYTKKDWYEIGDDF